MSFWDDVYGLRKQGLIPRVWTRADLRPLLKAEYPNAIKALPFRHSISEDGKVVGDFVQSGLRPEAWSLGDGRYRLVIDPDDDAATQATERQRAISGARAARVRFRPKRSDDTQDLRYGEDDVGPDSYPFGLLSHDYDNPFGPMYIDVRDLSP
jgi:hypothetical protein